MSEDRVTYDQENPTSAKNRIIVRSQKRAGTGWFAVISLGIISFIRNYWLLLVPMILIVFFCKSYGCLCGEDKFGSRNKESESYSAEIISDVVPNLPRIRPPLDTTKFIFDEGSYSRIVADRINIALKDRTVSIQDFLVDLYKNFMDSSHQVVYYDHETSRLQLQFDVRQRGSIKHDLRASMHNYDFLIWDESIFHTTVQFNDPVFSSADHRWYMDAVNATRAWQVTTGNDSVTVAIIDDGFDLTHPELLNKSLRKPYNLYSRDGSVYGTQKTFHGTHVAGIVFANQNNNIGGSGIAPNCSFMPIQLKSDYKYFTTTDVIDGILYAIKNGADVINISLGREFSPILSKIPSFIQEEIANKTGLDEAYFWQELYNYAQEENCMLVIAAGNQNILLSLNPMTRSESVIIVTAIDQNFSKAEFSNYGSTATLSAPGVQIYNSIPGNKFDFMDGTSMAAPIVTGAVALIKSLNPSLSNSQIIEILKMSAKPLSDNKIGPLLQIDEALYMTRSGINIP
jgi:subtilisin family serine protease